MDENMDITNHDLHAEVDEDGRIVLSPQLASRYGIKPGSHLYASEATAGLYLLRPVRIW